MYFLGVPGVRSPRPLRLFQYVKPMLLLAPTWCVWQPSLQVSTLSNFTHRLKGRSLCHVIECLLNMRIAVALRTCSRRHCSGWQSQQPCHLKGRTDPKAGHHKSKRVWVRISRHRHLKKKPLHVLIVSRSSQANFRSACFQNSISKSMPDSCCSGAPHATTL